MEWCESYNPNYFTVEDILATQERVSCKFDLPVFGLGYLNQSDGSPDIIAGMKLELPCWMARALCTQRCHIVTPQIPSTFKEKYREILKADPSVVNLHKLGPYFYESGQHLIPLSASDATQLASLLAQTLRERLRGIMDAAQNSLADESSHQVSNLDELERSLFRVGQSSLRDHELWLSRRSHLLRTSTMIEKLNKRKFSVISDT